MFKETESETAGQHLRALANNATAKRVAKIEAYFSRYLVEACEPFADDGKMTARVRFTKSGFGITDPKPTEVERALDNLIQGELEGISVQAVQEDIGNFYLYLSWQIDE